MNGIEKIEKGKKIIKKVKRIIVFLPLILKIFTTIIIVCGLFTLVITIYSSISSIGDSGNQKISDDYLAGQIIMNVYKDGFESEEPKGFPITGSFPQSTFKKHLGDGRYATVAIDFVGFFRAGGLDDSIRLKNKQENLNGNKLIGDYDLDYLNFPIMNLNSGPKYCTVGPNVSKVKTAPLYSTISGKVIKYKQNTDCFGNQIVIQGEKYAVNYAHLNEMFSKKGDELKAGELIGMLGNSGNSKGAHLHYDILMNRGLSGNIFSLITDFSASLGIGNFFAIKEEEYKRLLFAYGAYVDSNGERFYGDHVGKNAMSILGRLKDSNDIDSELKTGMEKFVAGGVEAVKWNLINHKINDKSNHIGVLKDKSEENVDFYAKLITWTVIGRENSLSYNRNSEVNSFKIARDGGAGLWQTQEPTDELKKVYEKFGGYGGEDGQGKVTPGYGCGWDWRKILHSQVIGKQSLINRGCDLDKDTRFDIQKSTSEHYSREIGNKITSCKTTGFSDKSWDQMTEFERGICIVTRYNGGTLWKDMQKFQIKFLEDITLGTDHFENCRKLEQDKEKASGKTYDNCAYSYQFALNYVKMIKFGSTQFDGLSRFNRNNYKKEVINLGDGNYSVPESIHRQ